MGKILSFPQPKGELSELLSRAWADRIIGRLLASEKAEASPVFRTDYGQSRVLIGLCLEGNPQPFIDSSYQMYGCHPGCVFEKVMAQRRAKLGRQYSLWYDKGRKLESELARDSRL
jgi:hypothetical protein